MSGGVNRGGLTPSRERGSRDDPDLALAMDLAYNLSRRKQKCSSPIYHSSNKSVKTRLSDRKDGTSTPYKTRARQIKDYETEPFLAVNTLPDEKKHMFADGGAKTFDQNLAGGQSSSGFKPMSPMAPRQISRFSMYSSASIPTRHTLTRGSNRRALASSMSHKTLTAHSKTRTPNHHIKMPFKHSVHKPVTPAQPDGAMSPSQELKERTALATYHVNKVLAVEKHTSHQKNKGKLLKAKLKPLYPVQIRGPSIENCRGIVADAHQYAASPSRTLQRRKQIISSMNSGELKDLMDRPHTVESIHRTSIASSVDENRDSQPQIEWSTENLSSRATTPGVKSAPSYTDQDLNNIVEPPDFATGSPIISRESSKDTLGDSIKDTSTVFLTSGRNVEEAEEAPISGEKIQPEVEDASRELIEMAEMLRKRISLIGIETGDLLEAESRGNDVKTEESSETESRSGAAAVHRDISELQDNQQSGTSFVESRVRPFSATAQLSQTVSPGKQCTRPLSTGDVSRRKVTGSKSVRFADETESPGVSHAWKEEGVNGHKSSENENTNNNPVTEGSSHMSSKQPKSRCKPNEKDLGKNTRDPDDDKENYAPKKSLYFTSSQTFSQAMATSSNPQSYSSESQRPAPKDDTGPVTRTSFMEEFLAHAAPIDDSVCSVSSEEYLQEDFKDKVHLSEEQKDPVKLFPLMSLSERIASTFKHVKPSDCEVTVSEHLKEVDEGEEGVTEEVLEEIEEPVPIVTDPAVNLTISSHDMLSQFEQNYGNVDTFKDKTPVNKTRRKKSKSKGNGKRTESPSPSGRPPNAGRPSSPNRNYRKERSLTTKLGKKFTHPSRYGSCSYGVEGRHHFPSDLIDDGESKTSGGTKQGKTRKSRSRPSSGSSVRPSSGHSASSYSSKASAISSHVGSEVPVLDFDAKDYQEETDLLSYDDIDQQINLIQSELKKNIDQQEKLLSETETLRHSLRSREGFYTDQEKEDKDSSTVTLQSDSYYQSLLMAYRKKCMEVSENCLMISEHITTPRWQQATGTTETREQPMQRKEKVSETQSDDVDLSIKAVPATNNRPEVDSGCESEAGLEPEKHENFLRLLCTTVEEVEEPVDEKSGFEIGSDLTPKKAVLKVVATRKELSNEKLKQSVKPSAPFPPLCFSINARPPQGYLYYFSYSEHMNTDRMSLYLKRSVTQRFWGLLMGFNLVFNKKGEDIEAGGFANIEFNPFCSVEGCVYQLTQEDLNVLDKCIGVPEHYCRVLLPVWMSNSTDPDSLGIAQYCVPAVTYIAKDHWLHRDPVPLSVGYSGSQCVKSADLLTPAYKCHLTKLANVSAPVFQTATA